MAMNPRDMALSRWGSFVVVFSSGSVSIDKCHEHDHVKLENKSIEAVHPMGQHQSEVASINGFTKTVFTEMILLLSVFIMCYPLICPPGFPSKKHYTVMKLQV